MANKGCKFFKSPAGDYCRVTNTGLVEQNCAFEDNRCYTEVEYVKKYGKSPPAVVAVVPGPSPAAFKSQQVSLVRGGLKYISGPISWYCYEFMGRMFHLFGDRHGGMSGTCEKRYNVKCSKINPITKKVDLAETCDDIVFLLTKLFNNSFNNKTYADFYLEYRYRLAGHKQTQIDILIEKSQKGEQLTEEEEEAISQSQYIWAIYATFHPCFQRSKEKCKYLPYVRFHNADVRQAIDIEYAGMISVNSYIFITILSNLQTMLESYYYLTQYVSPDDSRLQSLRKEIIDKTEFAQRILDKLLLTGQTLAGAKVNYSKDLFDALLYSNNYVEDVNKILDRLVEGIPVEVQGDFPKMRNTMTKLSVKRDGKVVSRVKAQIDGLRQDNIIYNGRNMADILLDFLREEYDVFSLAPAYNVWRKFYDKEYLPFKNIVTEADLERAIIAFNNANLDKADEQYVTLFASDALVMDAYLLARMLRKFTIPQHSRAPHSDSTLVVAYTGGKHTERYSRFFSKYLYVPLIDGALSTPEGTRCLVNPNFSRYFSP
jgi:hypothetical protein